MIIRQNREEAIPILLQRVKEVSERGETYDDSLNIGVYESYYRSFGNEMEQDTAGCRVLFANLL